MKMREDHFEYMRQKVLQAVGDFEISVSEYRRQLINAATPGDIEKRIRHDMLHMARIDRWICDELYSYLDDTHIDTALRKIAKEF